jgi:toxin ParE1/3/4
MRIRFHSEAAQEFEAASVYLEEREEGLGARFTQTIRAALKQISTHPDRWRVIEEDVRRCLTEVFPYAILYTIEQDSIEIVAIMHCRQDPGYWKHRTSQT